jgi:FkbM family methyltransferase
MKKFVRRLIHGRPSEEAQLIAKGSAFPRYTPTTVQYKGFSLKVTDLLSVAWQIQEFFAQQRMKFKAATSTPLIIDCGANVGVSVLYYKSLYPQAKVICFEPDPAVFACLQENLQANKITDVECRAEAVWVHGDGVSFGSEGADGGSILREANAVRLPSVRLKEVLEQHPKIDLLKIDIEGAEVPVLLDCAAALKRVNYLYVEYHSFPDKQQELHALLAVLAEQGFRYYIDRVGVNHHHPFAGLEDAAMDMQLDIHAVRG